MTMYARTLFGIAGAVWLAAGGAQAAPQVLGIVASNGPIPLTCDAGGCRADLSTFCLQQPRDNPQPGQSYMPLEGADIVLTGRNAAGETVRLPAASYLGFTTDREFTAIEVSLPAERLAALGLTDPAIEIGEKASLIPAAAANDADPQTAGEIAIATGAYRDKGAEFFDRAGEFRRCNPPGQPHDQRPAPWAPRRRFRRPGPGSRHCNAGRTSGRARRRHAGAANV